MQTRPKRNSDAVQSQSSIRRRVLQRELERWLPLLIENLHPEKILLFGSMTDKRLNEWSDIDLVIIYRTDLSFYRRIKQALQLIRPKVGVDLLLYTPEEFSKLSRERSFIRDEILEKGKVLYARS